jgi:hypothetical protein
MGTWGPTALDSLVGKYKSTYYVCIHVYVCTHSVLSGMTEVLLHLIRLSVSTSLRCLCVSVCVYVRIRTYSIFSGSTLGGHEVLLHLIRLSVSTSLRLCVSFMAKLSCGPDIHDVHIGKYIHTHKIHTWTCADALDHHTWFAFRYIYIYIYTHIHTHITYIHGHTLML